MLSHRIPVYGLEVMHTNEAVENRDRFIYSDCHCNHQPLKHVWLRPDNDQAVMQDESGEAKNFHHSWGIG